MSYTRDKWSEIRIPEDMRRRDVEQEFAGRGISCAVVSIRDLMILLGAPEEEEEEEP